jgi:hypothetical protein
VVGLSGCSEKKIEILGDTDKVEFVNYNIEVFDKNMNKIGDSFNHSGQANLYKIKGTVKNIAGIKLADTWISARFHDRSDNYLDSRTYLIPSLEINEEANFSFMFTYSSEYFDKIWNVYFVFVALRG